MRRFRLVLAAWLVLGATTTATATAAQPAATPAAAAAAACRGTSGVTVVVDYGRRSAGGVDLRCAPGDPANGLAALSGAGFSYTFVPRQPGLVCTIENVPDPCNGAPPQAYWSYWHLRADKTWVYSDIGPSGYNPAPGASEGWAFGSGKPPRLPRP